MFVIVCMRLIFTSLILFWITTASYASDSLRVYVCESGQVKYQVWQAKDVSTHKQLLRTGNAYWLDGRVDDVTALAMFESAGIWSFASVLNLFEKLNTKTSPDVLASISLTESGRGGRPWPWTINHKGKSHFFDSKEKAVKTARALISRGETIFDVGIMQINWHFNSKRFASVESAFDPLVNIGAADQIIQEHLGGTGSIREAVGRYHSKTPTLKTTYIERVGHQAKQILRSPFQQPRTLSC
ncbi:MAG: lytic transglycosylase domain-containing protein [Limnohabitans sp.]|jgi:hypothetical protein|nr:lytic transglycosylase domain-containing protein [Limnohabitans sp.]